MKSFFALVTPFDPSLKPDHTLPGPQPTPPLPGTQPPVVDNTLPGDLPHPEHPIYWPLPPNAPVDPGYGIPEEGAPPVVDNTLPGNSGGWLPVYIDNTLPGDLPHPDHTLPGAQPGIDNTLPVPPDIPVPPEVGISGTIKFKAIWTPANGWQTIGVVIPGDKPIPTPSKKK